MPCILLEAVAFGRWPDHAADLVAHAATCAVCADLADVALALHDDREAACREAPVPAAGIVWWRLTIRRVDFTSASTLAMEHALPLVLALAACLVLAPLALYITLADD